MDKEMSVKLDKYREVIHRLTGDPTNFQNIITAFRGGDIEEIRKALDTAQISGENCQIICRLECILRTEIDPITHEEEKWVECGEKCVSICAPFRPGVRPDPKPID